MLLPPVRSKQLSNPFPDTQPHRSPNTIANPCADPCADSRANPCAVDGTSNYGGSNTIANAQPNIFTIDLAADAGANNGLPSSLLAGLRYACCWISQCQPSTLTRSER